MQRIQWIGRPRWRALSPYLAWGRNAGAFREMMRMVQNYYGDRKRHRMAVQYGQELD